MRCELRFLKKGEEEENKKKSPELYKKVNVYKSNLGKLYSISEKPKRPSPILKTNKKKNTKMPMIIEKKMRTF